MFPFQNEIFVTFFSNLLKPENACYVRLRWATLHYVTLSKVKLSYATLCYVLLCVKKTFSLKRLGQQFLVVTLNISHQSNTNHTTSTPMISRGIYHWLGVQISLSRGQVDFI